MQMYAYFYIILSCYILYILYIYIILYITIFLLLHNFSPTGRSNGELFSRSASLFRPAVRGRTSVTPTGGTISPYSDLVSGEGVVFS